MIYYNQTLPYDELALVIVATHYVPLKQKKPANTKFTGFDLFRDLSGGEGGIRTRGTV